jgi:hypothetical protein
VSKESITEWKRVEQSGRDWKRLTDRRVRSEREGTSILYREHAATVRTLERAIIPRQEVLARRWAEHHAWVDGTPLVPLAAGWRRKGTRPEESFRGYALNFARDGVTLIIIQSCAQTMFKFMLDDATVVQKHVRVQSCAQTKMNVVGRRQKL